MRIAIHIYIYIYICTIPICIAHAAGAQPQPECRYYLVKSNTDNKNIHNNDNNNNNNNINNNINSNKVNNDDNNIINNNNNNNNNSSCVQKRPQSDSVKQPLPPCGNTPRCEVRPEHPSGGTRPHQSSYGKDDHNSNELEELRRTRENYRKQRLAGCLLPCCLAAWPTGCLAA